MTGDEKKVHRIVRLIFHLFTKRHYTREEISHELGIPLSNIERCCWCMNYRHMKFLAYAMNNDQALPDVGNIVAYNRELLKYYEHIDFSIYEL